MFVCAGGDGLGFWGCCLIQVGDGGAFIEPEKRKKKLDFLRILIHRKDISIRSGLK